MLLPNLANELLLLIAENLLSSDLNSLLQANRRLATLLTPLLHTLALQDKNKVPALCWAAIGGYEPLIRVILDSGADINVQDKRSFWERKFATAKEKAIDSEETALHLAIGYKHKAVVTLLLERKADMTLRDGSGKTPILRAAATSMEMFLLLVEYGADISPSDNNGLTALHLATFYRHSTLAKYLLGEGVEIDIQENLGQTPLQIATTFTHNTCEKGYKETFEIVKMLLEGGANVNACDNNDLSPLFYAVHFQGNGADCGAVTRLLLEYGADVNRHNGVNGETALHQAVKADSKDLAKFLLENGAIDQPNYEGQTALQSARISGQSRTVKLLEGTVPQCCAV